MKIDQAVNELQKMQQADPDQEICLAYWSREDLLHVEQDNGIEGVTDEERDEVLSIVEDKWDANDGINWDFILYWLRKVVEVKNG
tara:strand:+ start:1029 stop:1283 length:255 start_codon:yes stop_codon:yes gene_type:complete